MKDPNVLSTHQKKKAKKIAKKIAEKDHLGKVKG
jgi:hypothetical protein